MTFQIFGKEMNINLPDNSDDISLDPIKSAVKYELDSLEKKLKSALKSDVSLLDNICDSLISNPGKRLRPNVLFLAARNADGDPEKSITAGFAVELIHTATLIHDDIIDNHDFRRGRPTVSSKWGRNIAIIMGDYLYSKAFSALSRDGIWEVMSILARATNAMSVGEMLQFQHKRDVNVSEESYLNLINKKTASLFAAACESGAILGPNGGCDRNEYSMFGENIGLAYQITDDLFDYLAAEEYMGKPVAADLFGGKVTLPFITSYKNAPENVRLRVSDILSRGFDKEGCWDEMLLFIKNYGGVEYSIEKARNFGEKAKTFLNTLSPSPETELLCYAADYIVERIIPYSG
jgi:octaprenyl-diphosphate synthase